MEESFKRRLYNHILPFRNELYKKHTELSQELWQIKKNYTSKITWEENYESNESRNCYLALNEKLEIALYKGKTY